MPASTKNTWWLHWYQTSKNTPFSIHKSLLFGRLLYFYAMANTYFQFKQFRVEQDRCAMKVCTDACWFGARVAQLLAADWKDLPMQLTDDGPWVMDIGTGTGLLSLILAQALPQTIITALEIEPGAAQQASENFAASPWRNRLRPVPQSLNQYILEWSPKGLLDAIITNPPFYENDLEGPDLLKNQAHHGQSLPLAVLLSSLPKTLKPGAPAFLLLPPKRLAFVQKWCTEYNCFLARIETLAPAVGKPIFRLLIEMRSLPNKSPSLSINTQGSLVDATPQPLSQDWYIKTVENQYNPAFSALMQPYYLNP